jgi:hypothetical protein
MRLGSSQNRKSLLNQLWSLLDTQQELLEGDFLLSVLLESHRERWSRDIKNSLSEILKLSEQIYGELEWKDLRDRLANSKVPWDLMILVRESRMKILNLLRNDADFVSMDSIEVRGGHSFGTSLILRWRNVPGIFGTLIAIVNLLSMIQGVNPDYRLWFWAAFFMLICLSPDIAAKGLSAYVGAR